ncbi:hypothetical protein PV08_06544 [Exophiala spinifera]|uniref:Uncharacterized protein n=1 Tax=Exophiala spinifera TaxID=91928 RepID=A0A0D2BYW0_9EURO|nr:uncharacterized protein PV08_06544 [Exophiala spinifera]KIW16489.1 hypothetical protein PV08_06544 [Exophiala spinifera]
MSADLFAAFVTADDNHGEVGDAIQPPLGKVEQDLDGHDFSVRNVTTPGGTAPGLQATPLWKRDVGGNDVLFDAEDEPNVEDDDFGDFEIANASEGTAPHNQLHHTSHESVSLGRLIPDLLDDGNHRKLSFSGPPTASTIVTNPGAINQTNLPPTKLETRSEGSQDQGTSEGWSEFEDAQNVDDVRTPEEPFKKPEDKPFPSQGTTVNDEDEWEPFEDGQTDMPPQPPPSVEPEIASTGSRPISTFQAAIPSFERPTNVPPPSSLLQLMSTVFDQLHQANVTNNISKPALATKVLLVYRTASRLAAGRSLRWKRDALLSQSMKIGQAGARGGMKLASVDKGEAAKESRDLEEMIHDWMKNIHEYNSIIAHAGLPPQRLKMSAAPNLRIQKSWGSSDIKQCALCGLKRTERLVDVDVDTDDLFGEFWTEHWGHKDCYEFWYSYKGLLAQR